MLSLFTPSIVYYDVLLSSSALNSAVYSDSNVIISACASISLNFRGVVLLFDIIQYLFWREAGRGGGGGGGEGERERGRETPANFED